MYMDLKLEGKMDFNRENLTQAEYADKLLDLQQTWKKCHNEFTQIDKDKINIIKKENSKSILTCETIENEDWKEYNKNRFFTFSNYGRVKFNGLIVPQKEDCWLKLDKKAFRQLYPNIDYNGFEEYQVHSIMAEVFLGKIVGKYLEVHHINDNEYDNSLDNLVLLTNTEHSLVHNKRIPKFYK